MSFANWNAICHLAWVPSCHLFPVMDAKSMLLDEQTGMPVTNIGDIVMCVVALVVSGTLFRLTRRKIRSVGFMEMRALLVFYGTMVFVQIFANGNFLPDLSVVRGFAAVYNAVQACTAWVLFYNGVIAFQTIPDGSLLSLLMLTATVLIGFLINLILSIDTFKNFSGQFPPSPNGIDVINVALFVFNLLLPALCVMGYWIMQMVVVLKELSDWSPLLYLAVSVIAFALSEVFIFIVSPYVAAGAHHRADGSFLGTLFMLIAMIFVFQYWWHVTDDEEDDFQLEPTMEESGHQEKRQDNYGSQERLHDIQI